MNALGINYIICFISHIFWTTNARMPIKGSKDSDLSLVSNTNMSRKTPYSNRHQGHGSLGQSGLKSTPLMTSVTKYPKPKTFQCFLMQARKLAASFEDMNSSLAQPADELC